MNPSTSDRLSHATKGIAYVGGSLLTRKHFVVAILIVAFLYSSVSSSARATDPPNSLQNEVAAIFERVDRLLEELEYDEAARILEGMLIKDIPLEAKIKINTKLAFVYEQSRYEQKAIECLLENLRALPSYDPPDSLRTHLQHLYTKALEAYQKEQQELNTPPEFVNPPESLKIKPGEQLHHLFTASDADNDTLRLSISEGSDAELRDHGNGSGLVTYEVPKDPHKIATSLSVVVNDGQAADTAIIALVIVPEDVIRPASVLSQSVLIPGRGQFNSGRRKMGTALFAAQLATLGASIGFTLSYNNAIDDYNSSLDRYRSASDSHQLVDALDDARAEYRAVSDKEKLRNIAFLAAGAVYVVNVLDAVLSKPDTASTSAFGQNGSEPSPALRAKLKVNPGGVSLCLNW